MQVDDCCSQAFAVRMGACTHCQISVTQISAIREQPGVPGGSFSHKDLTQLVLLMPGYSKKQIFCSPSSVTIDISRVAWKHGSVMAKQQDQPSLCSTIFSLVSPPPPACIPTHDVMHCTQGSLTHPIKSLHSLCLQ